MKQILLSAFLILSFGYSKPDIDRIPVIVDTDANNELDDQHAPLEREKEGGIRFLPIFPPAGA